MICGYNALCPRVRSDCSSNQLAVLGAGRELRGALLLFHVHSILGIRTSSLFTLNFSLLFVLLIFGNCRYACVRFLGARSLFLLILALR
ncbi:unnamed protein product [Calicophoron daubneyi]|uniref:Uncharacterized protein n=1 Tax=Calicophoron daubneyi TaxID=300641 RepID=A0AAV2T4Z1_CALDB